MDRALGRGTQQQDLRTSESRERTLLADDRTLLAWYRTAFGAYALAVGLGGIVPKVAPHASSWYRVIGVMFAVLGIIAPIGGAWQYVVFQRQAGKAQLPRPNLRFVVAFGLLASLFGVGIAVLIGIGA